MVREEGAEFDPLKKAGEYLGDSWDLHQHHAKLDTGSQAKMESFISSLFETKHALTPRDPMYLEETTEQVRTYLNASWMHTPRLTDWLLGNLIDAELAPWQISKNFAFWFHLMLMVIILLPALLKFGLGIDSLYRIATYLGWLTYALYAYCAWVLFYYVLSTRYRHRRIPILRLIRDEVASGKYDGVETARRLRDLEERGLFVHSLAYALLRLGATAMHISHVGESDAGR